MCHCRSLATSLQDLSTSLKKTQNEYLNKVQKLKEGGGDEAFTYLNELEKGMNTDGGFGAVRRFFNNVSAAFHSF